MANSYNNRTFKIKTSSNPKLIFAIIALILGLASLFFLLAPGINFTYAGSSKLHTISLGGLVWGSTYTNLSAGLVVAFFLGIVASLLALATPGLHFIGYLAGLLFIACGALYFSAIPLLADDLKIIGYESISLGYGVYTAGICQFIAAILSFIAAYGE